MDPPASCKRFRSFHCVLTGRVARRCSLTKIQCRDDQPNIKRPSLVASPSQVPRTAGISLHPVSFSLGNSRTGFCCGTVIFDAIAAPKISWKNIIEIFSETLKHENHVTALINNLMNVAISEKDYAASNFLQWFVNEQVEEESAVCNIIDQIKLAGETGPGIYMIDKELSLRIFVDPTITAIN